MSSEKKPIPHAEISIDKSAKISKVSFSEEFSKLYQCNIEAYSKKTIDESCLGKPANITINFSKEKREIAGIITSINTGNNKEHQGYQALSITISPNLWLTTINKNCRIFQKLTIQEIIKKVLKPYGINNAKFDTSSGSEKKDYVTQYNETDYDFFLRLLEENGMIYSFKHESGKETLIISDSNLQFKKPVKEPLIYSAPEYEETTLNRIKSFFKQKTIVPNIFKTTSYDFEKPSNNLLTKEKSKLKGDNNIYSYETLFKEKNHGEEILKNEITRNEALEETFTAITTCPEMEIGKPFKLKRHPDKNLNEEYYPIKTKHEMSFGEKNEDSYYKNESLCLLKKTKFLSKRSISRPVVYGHESAIVVGPDGEEIYCDELGRVKVQFHWDLDGEKNEESSCWLRVLQPWAGSGWGSFFTPRIGMEVIVSFQMGNPDLPMIMGCVYNGKNKPENAKENPTKSGIKTQSTKEKKDGFNEITFEDKADEEEIIIHAEKDFTKRIRANLTEELYEEGNHTYSIEKGNRDEKIKEGNDEKTLEKGNEKITIKEGNYERELQKGDYKLSVKDGNLEISIKGSSKTITEKAESHTNKDTFNRKVSKEYGLKAKSIKLEASESIDLKANKINMSAQDSVVIKAGKVTIQAEMGNIEIKGDVGNISLKASAGKVEISGTAGFEAKSDAPAKISSSSKLDLKGAIVEVKADAMGTLDLGPMGKVKATGMLDLDGGGMLKAKGGIAMIN